MDEKTRARMKAELNERMKGMTPEQAKALAKALYPGFKKRLLAKGWTFRPKADENNDQTAEGDLKAQQDVVK